MHPILFSIPINWGTVIFVALFLGGGTLIRTRFAPAEQEASYLASFLGLNVNWAKVRKGWGESLLQGAVSGVIFGGAVLVAKYAILGVDTTILGKHIAFGSFFPDAKPAPGQPLELPLHIYGIMMATAFLVAIWLATREATHEQLPPVTYKTRDGKKVTITSAELVSDLSFWIFVSGLGGSRALYIVTRWDAEYSHHPLLMFNPFAGGLVWYGGLIAATATTWWFVHKHKVAFLPYADVLVPGVSIAHAIGRLGCFSAGCCFGNIARKGFPLAVQFPPGSPAAIEHWGDLGLHMASKAVYPTQIMEAAGELMIFTTLLYLRSRKKFHGQVVLTYFFLYAILRTIMEMFRGDTIRGFLFEWPDKQAPMLMSTSQAASIFVAVAGIIATVVISRSRHKKAESESRMAGAA